MADLSFLESMKDRMGRVGSCPFSPHVEDATSELLLEVDPEKINQLVHFGNQGEEHAVNLVQALRRRIDHKSPKVQCFVVVALDAVIRGCGPVLHEELAKQKGLLRDLVLMAARDDSSKQAVLRARELAATLVLNCSYWFADHRNDVIRDALSQLANHARTAGAKLEGIEADRTVQIRTEEISGPANYGSINGETAAASRPRTRQQAQQQRASNRQSSGQQREHQERAVAEARNRATQRRHVVVDAIPIKTPSEEALVGMMEAVILLAECLDGVSARGEDARSNDTVNVVSGQVRRDHEKINELVACGVSLPNMDALLALNDSQVEILQRHTETLMALGAAAGSGPASSIDDQEAAAIAASLAEAQQPQAPVQQPPAATTSRSLGTYRERLTRYYEFYNPEKLDDVNTVLAKFVGREEQMMDQLRAKYGDEPMPPVADTRSTTTTPPPTATTTSGATAPTTAAAPGTTAAPGHMGTYRDRVGRFLEFYAPDRLNTLDTVLERWVGREEELLVELRKRYGDEPMPPQDQPQSSVPAHITPLHSAAQPPAAQTPGSSHVDRGTYRERIQRFLEFYDPDKLKQLDLVMARFAGREEELLLQFGTRYGDEPLPAVETPVAAVSSIPTAGPSPPTMGSYRERLTRFYEFYCPEKLRDVELVLAKFEGREEFMIRQLKSKYGDEPMPPIADHQPVAPAPSANSPPIGDVVPTSAPVAEPKKESLDQFFAAPTPTVEPRAPAQEPRAKPVAEPDFDPFAVPAATPPVMPMAAAIPPPPPPPAPPVVPETQAAIPPPPPAPPVVPETQPAAAPSRASAFPPMTQSLDPQAAPSLGLTHTDEAPTAAAPPPPAAVEPIEAPADSDLVVEEEASAAEAKDATPSVTQEADELDLEEEEAEATAPVNATVEPEQPPPPDANPSAHVDPLAGEDDFDAFLDSRLHK